MAWAYSRTPALVRAGLSRRCPSSRSWGLGVPPGGGLLGLRPELDGAVSGNVAGTKLGFVPTTEGKRLARYWYPNVDPDHTRRSSLGNLARCPAVFGENRRCIPVRRGVLDSERLVEVRSADDRQHRPEDLLSGNSHVWTYPIQNGGPNPEAAFSPRDAGVAPVEQQGGPRRDSLIHGSANALAALTGNYRTEISARHQRPGLLNQALDDVICPGYSQHHRSCHASLAGTSRHRAQHTGGSHIGIGIRKHKEVILGASESQRTLQA